MSNEHIDLSRGILVAVMRKLSLCRGWDCSSGMRRRSRFVAGIIASILLAGPAAASIIAAEASQESGAPPTYMPEMLRIAARALAPPPVNGGSGPSRHGAIWLSGPLLAYPPEMAAAARWGFAVAECDIDIGGTPERCGILSLFGGAAFGEAAKTFLLKGHYALAVHDGVASATTERFFIDFKLPGPERVEGPPFADRPPNVWGWGGYVDVSCHLDETGHPSQCHAFASDAGEAFEDAAVHYVSAGRYRPMTRDSIPVSQDECLFHIERW